MLYFLEATSCILGICNTNLYLETTKMKNFSPQSTKYRGLKPPALYEYFLDNFWFKSAGLENEVINEPLRGSHKADIVIIGGGYTGLSSAYNIHRRFPDKKIMLLEGACCGYGASGRNGGFCIATSLLDPSCKDSETRKKIWTSVYTVLVRSRSVLPIMAWSVILKKTACWMLPWMTHRPK